MISISPWFERSFRLDLEAEYFPLVVERLRGTPVRLENLVQNIEPATLVEKRGDVWSSQEHAGHLVDLEGLWAGRVDDIMNGAIEMRAADLTNRATHEADHHEKPIAAILHAFESARHAFVRRLDDLDLTDVAKSARHPRLKTDMRIIDLATFVAEHDDHHLAIIRHRLENQISA